MQKLVLVNQIDSMEVPVNIEALTPVLFESVAALKAHISSLVDERLQKFLEIEKLKPSDADSDLSSAAIDMSDEEVAASEPHRLAIERCNAYYTPYTELCLSQQAVDINGTKVDISRFLDHYDFVVNLPEVMTLEEWFDSRLPRFQVEVE